MADLVLLLLTQPAADGAVLRCRAALGIAPGAPPDAPALTAAGLEGRLLETAVPLLVAELGGGALDSPALAGGGPRAARADR